jgi:hypothetical protein
MKNLKLKLIFFLFLITIASCSGLKNQRNPATDQTAQSTKPRHIIFLVHGIAGSEKSFGYMNQALTSHLNNEFSVEGIEYEYSVENFIYQTKSNKNNTEQFAKDLGNAIDKYFVENGAINPQDKISLIAHSQGGVVSLIWLYRATLGDVEFNSKYVEHVDSYITLGTPFWGAKMAVFGGKLKEMAKRLGDNVIPIFGDQQLHDMSFGSPVIFNFRKNAIDPEYQNVLKKMDLHIRPVNFGGAATNMKLFSPFAIGLKEYEDDSAVPLPSSHFDFIYASSFKKNYKSGDILPSSSFIETHFSKHHVVDALHLSVVPSVHYWTAIADIPSECVEDAECNHPTYKYVLAHLLHIPYAPSEKLLSKMTGFILDVNVRLPDGDQLSADKIKIKFSSNDRDILIASPMEFYNHGYSMNSADKTYRQFYFTGSVNNSFIPQKDRGDGAAFKDKTMTATISAPGYKSRIIKAKVRPTYSTFIEINLEKSK